MCCLYPAHFILARLGVQNQEADEVHCNEKYAHMWRAESPEETCEVDERKYSWVPPGLSNREIDDYFSQLSEHQIPVLGSDGEGYRNQQLIHQLPKQDLAASYCKYLDKEFIALFENFVNTRNESALDIGYVSNQLDQEKVCTKCELPFQYVCVVAAKLGSSFHPSCFICSVCQELLIDFTYCIKENSLYCERHYAELIKPRCSACDEFRTRLMNEWKKHNGNTFSANDYKAASEEVIIKPPVEEIPVVTETEVGTPPPHPITHPYNPMNIFRSMSNFTHYIDLYLRIHSS